MRWYMWEFLEYNISMDLCNFQHFLEFVELKLGWKYLENLKTTSSNLNLGSRHYRLWEVPELSLCSSLPACSYPWVLWRLLHAPACFCSEQKYPPKKIQYLNPKIRCCHCNLRMMLYCDCVLGMGIVCHSSE